VTEVLTRHRRDAAGSDVTAAVVTLAWRGVVIGAMRRTCLTVSANMATHCDTITMISLGSPFWVYTS
jgi:hypothetical protein